MIFAVNQNDDPNVRAGKLIVIISVESMRTDRVPKKVLSKPVEQLSSAELFSCISLSYRLKHGGRDHVLALIKQQRKSVRGNYTAGDALPDARVTITSSGLLKIMFTEPMQITESFLEQSERAV